MRITELGRNDNYEDNFVEFIFIDAKGEPEDVKETVTKGKLISIIISQESSVKKPQYMV